MTRGKSADVYRGNQLAGRITRTQRGSFYEYHPTFLEAARRSDDPSGIAFQLPLSAVRTETTGINLHPFFAGLLPEGLRLRAIVRRVKTSEDDLMSLLMAIGSDSIGDISVIPEGELPTSPASVVDTAQLSEVSFAELFKRSVLDLDSKLLEQVNIPGEQDKISASTISFPLKARTRSAPCILKLNPIDKPRLVENEDFFIRMAKACGLVTNDAVLVRDRDLKSGLLVQRFDRILGKEPTSAPDEWLKIHQEDACQFLNRYPADKYRIKTSEVAEGLGEFCSAPIIEVAKLIQLTAFSYLICNGDLHAKNISIRVSPKTSRIELTPAYDLLSTLPYGDQKMALQFEGRDDNLKRKHFVSFGERYAVKAPAVHRILDELYGSSGPWIERVGEIGLDERKSTHLRKMLRKRREDLVK